MSSSRISLKTLEAKHKKDVAYLLKLYTENEVLSKFVQFNETDKSWFVDSYLKLSVNGLSFGVFDNDTDTLIGISISSIPKNFQDIGDFDEVEEKFSSEAGKLFRFELYMEEGTVEFLGSENYMTGEIGFILPQYRRTGLFERIWKRNIEIAQEQNVDGILTVFNSNTIGEKIIKNFVGFLPLRRVYYKDYRDSVTGEAIFTGLPLSTHRYATQMIKFCKPAKL